MFSLTIRPARASDVFPVAAIVKSSPTAPQWTPDQFAAMLVAPGPDAAVIRAFLVAESSDAVVEGFAVVSALRAVFPVEAELESVAVAPALRGQGIGRSLVREALAWAAAQSATEVRLEVRQGNAVAIALYRSLDFHPAGKRARYYAHPVEDALSMVKRDGDPGSAHKPR